jgi:FAD:protein FMN transferase
MPSSRRAFLTGAGLRSPHRAPASPADYFLRLSRPAMACTFELLLRPLERDRLPAAQHALERVDAIESQLTVFRETSEVSRLNRDAAARPVRVSGALHGLLRLARDIGHETAGAYDVTCGALVRCWGFLRRSGRIPDGVTLDRARNVSGWSRVLFDDAAETIAFATPGLEINLGSIGKGYALDHIAAALRADGVHDFLLHAGHSSVLAAGESGTAKGWTVAIADGRRLGARLGTIALCDQSLSTSGIGQQGFTIDGRRYGHIIDPRSGEPSDACVQSSVVAPSAAVSEALSTAFFVMQEQEVRAYCAAHPAVGRVTLRPGVEAPIVDRVDLVRAVITGSVPAGASRPRVARLSSS